MASNPLAPLTPELIHPSETPEVFSGRMLTDQQNRNNSQHSFPLPVVWETYPWPEKNVGSTVVRHVFWRHIGENAPRLVEVINGCDVLALEGTGNTDPNNPDLSDLKVKRNTVSVIINGLLGADLTKDEKRIFDKHVEDETNPDISSRQAWLASHHNVYGQVFANLLDSGTRVEWLDVEARHSSKMWKFDEVFDEALTGFYYQFHKGASFDTLVQALVTAKVAEAKMTDFREQIAKRQLEKLVEKYKGANIAVVYGASHVAMTRMIETPGVTMQRVFLKPEGDVSEVEKSNNVNSIEHAGSNILRATGSVSQSLIETEVLDRIAFSLLVGKRDKKYLNRYVRLGYLEKAGLLEEVMDLWKDGMPLATKADIKQIEKRLNTTKKIIKSSL